MRRLDDLSISTVKLRMQFSQGENNSREFFATGFFWRKNEKSFLVTNWHNVTGRHFENKKPLDTKESLIPNQAFCEYYIEETNGSVTDIFLHNFTLPLFPEKKFENQPFWYEHPKEEVDIVVFPIDISRMKQNWRMVYANEFDCDAKIEVAQNVFILGYPKNISAGGFPVWKRGSIASEPEINAYLGKRCLLVDTATKEGMSGAPVFYIESNGIYRNEHGGLCVGSKPVKKFLGIYSGRLGKNEFEAQLGIVWKKEIIEEIINQEEISKYKAKITLNSS